MLNVAADPVPSIREADATGDIAVLYDDIRATLGVPVVNLIWRHLAVLPGGLSWAWATLKPIYANGAIAAEANALRDGLQVPTLPGLTAPALSSVGLGKVDLKQINVILASYEQSNAMNIIALGALVARLEGIQTVSKRFSTTRSVSQLVEGRMPPLLTLDEMSSDVRALVNGLNAVGGRAEILASMYRHLANWPPYLGLISALITPMNADGRREAVILGVIAEGRRRAASLAGALATPEDRIDAGIQNDIGTALNRFIDGPIGKMIAVVPLIKKAMPN